MARDAFAPLVASSMRDLEHLSVKWLGSDALSRTVKALDGPPVGLDPSMREGLCAWTSEVLDTRQNRERREAPLVLQSDSAIQELIACAAPLGLMSTNSPTRSQYDAAVVLGGATTGNRRRAHLARELNGLGVGYNQLVGLAGRRPLTEHEFATDPDSIADVDEYQNMKRNLLSAFGPVVPGRASSENAADSAWTEEEFRSHEDLPIILMKAPALGGRKRANTLDAARHLVSRLDLRSLRTVLIVTSSIYSVYQFLTVGSLLLPQWSGHLELVGTTTILIEDTGLLAQRIGQEVHASVHAVHGTLLALGL